MTSKAQAFALAAEALGWTVKRIRSQKPETPNARRVVATRGEEKYVMDWDTPASGREGFQGGKHVVGGHSDPVPLVKGALAAMAGTPVVSVTNADGSRSKLPFDPASSTDAEVLAALSGRRIVWANELAGLTESGTVPKVGTSKHLKIEWASTGERVLSFVNAEPDLQAYRAVHLRAIRRVS